MTAKDETTRIAFVGSGGKIEAVNNMMVANGNMSYRKLCSMNHFSDAYLAIHIGRRLDQNKPAIEQTQQSCFEARHAPQIKNISSILLFSLQEIHQ